MALAFLPSNFVSSGEQPTPSEAELPARGESIEMLFPVFEPDQPRDFFSGKYRGKKKRGFTCMVGRKMLKTWQIDLNFFWGEGGFWLF